jgi:hypothetical protein
MDSITLILSALRAGAIVSRFSAIASEISKDSYNKLQTLLLRQFKEEDHKAPTLLSDYEDDPETYERPLKQLLTEVHADENEEIVQAAKNLIRYAQPLQAAMSTSRPLISGNVSRDGLAQADHQYVINIYQEEHGKRSIQE